MDNILSTATNVKELIMMSFFIIYNINKTISMIYSL